jgi:hypothetical protein
MAYQSDPIRDYFDGGYGLPAISSGPTAWHDRDARIGDDLASMEVAAMFAARPAGSGAFEVVAFPSDAPRFDERQRSFDLAE